MKKIILLLVLIVASGCKETNNKDHEEHNHKDESTVSKKKVLSPHTSAMAMIGDAHIHIDYSSPGVRNRMIFGGLLAYDEVWQAGAHNATWIETNKDLIIDGKELKAGKYGFFTIPSKDEWILIFNSRWNQHGKDEYNPQEDILRISVKPQTLNEVNEHLTYQVKETGKNKGEIVLMWEKVKIQFPFMVKQ